MMKISILSPLVAPLLIVVAGFAAYGNSLHGDYLLDDGNNILENPRIRELWPPWKPLDVFSGPVTGVSGRPIYNFSFAVNYAIHGFDPVGYHVVNILIHLACALLLFGILRRTFASERLCRFFGESAGPLALAVALVWLLHPLQTTSVTYLSQRAESLFGFFLLLALYCAIRGFASSRPWWWRAAAAGATLLAMGVKEAAVVIPLLVLLYDRTFVAQSFRAALRRRWPFYLVLGGTWIALAAVVVTGGRLASTASLVRPVTSIDYAMTQPGAILHYLRLVFWPDPLIFHYWWPIATSVIPAIVMVVFLIATVVALRRLPAVGFAGACFFLLLAPSSSIVPIPREIAAEHRMYLPLAVVLALVLAGLFLFLRRTSAAPRESLFPAIVAMLCLLLGILTATRNNDYRSAERMWRDTVAKHPENPLAFNGLGVTLAGQERVADALPCFEAATFLLPDDPTPRTNYGTALAVLGRREEAARQWEEVLRRRPDHVDALRQLILVYGELGRYDDAAKLEEQYRSLPRPKEQR